MSETAANSGFEAMATKAANLEVALDMERKKTRELRKVLGVDSVEEALEAVKSLSESAKRVPGLEKELAVAQKGTPDEKDATIKELQGKLRARDFRDGFTKSAPENVNAKHLDSLYKLSELQPPEEGDITPDHFKDFWAKAPESFDWAFLKPESQGQSGSAGSSVNGAAGQQRINPTPPGQGVTRGEPERNQQARDPRAAALSQLQATTGHGNPFRIA